MTAAPDPLEDEEFLARVCVEVTTRMMSAHMERVHHAQRTLARTRRIAVRVHEEALAACRLHEDALRHLAAVKDAP